MRTWGWNYWLARWIGWRDILSHDFPSICSMIFPWFTWAFPKKPILWLGSRGISPSSPSSPPSPPKGSGMGIEPRPSTSRLLGWMANKHASPCVSVDLSFHGGDDWQQAGYQIMEKNIYKLMVGWASPMTLETSMFEKRAQKNQKQFRDDSQKFRWSWNLHSMNLCKMQGWDTAPQQFAPPQGPKSI